MEAALYAPGLGYYSAGSAKFAARGDFLTAPTLSSAFSRCVARQIDRILRAMGGGLVLEAGAGTGDMAAVIIETLAALDTPCGGYLILERSADLAERQRARIDEARRGGADHRLDVQWLESLPELGPELGPEPGFRGVIVANELLDAISVARFELDRGERFEWHVGLDDRGAFTWVRRAPGAELEGALGALIDELRDGPWSDPEQAPWLDRESPVSLTYTSEIGLAADAWIAELAGRLEQGAMLLFDYGYARHEYYHSQRRAGTLRCHYRHRAFDDPLWMPGLCDISAHVDFTGIARAGANAGLTVAGFTSQADFLLGSGLLDEAAGLSPGTAQFAELTAQIKRLTLPGEMGEAVKAMLLTRGLAPGPGDAPMLPGFASRDRRGSLQIA